MAGAERKGISIRLGPRRPATQFLLRLALMAAAAYVFDLATPDGAYKGYIILACLLVGAGWLYLEASLVAAVRIEIDPARTRMQIDRHYLLTHKRDVLALANVEGLDIHWSDDHRSLEAQDISQQSVDSVALVTKDGHRIVLVGPSQLNSVSKSDIEKLVLAIEKALGRKTSRKAR